MIGGKNKRKHDQLSSRLLLSDHIGTLASQNGSLPSERKTPTPTLPRKEKVKGTGTAQLRSVRQNRMKINLSQEDIQTGLDKSSMTAAEKASHHSINTTNALPDIYQAIYLNSISKKTEGSDNGSSIGLPRENSLDIEMRLRKEKRKMPMAFGKVNHRYDQILERNLVQKNQSDVLEPII